MLRPLHRQLHQRYMRDRCQGVGLRHFHRLSSLMLCQNKVVTGVIHGPSITKLVATALTAQEGVTGHTNRQGTRWTIHLQSHTRHTKRPPSKTPTTPLQKALSARKKQAGAVLLLKRMTGHRIRKPVKREAKLAGPVTRRVMPIAGSPPAKQQATPAGTASKRTRQPVKSALLDRGVSAVR